MHLQHNIVWITLYLHVGLICGIVNYGSMQAYIGRITHNFGDQKEYLNCLKDNGLIFWMSFIIFLLPFGILANIPCLFSRNKNKLVFSTDHYIENPNYYNSEP